MPSFPEQQLTATRADADAWLDANIGYLWPRAVTPDGAFNRKLVTSTYVRVNVDPSERYVLTLPGTPQYRLRSDASGFDNPFLAGDWTQTSINAGWWKPRRCRACARQWASPDSTSASTTMPYREMAPTSVRKGLHQPAQQIHNERDITGSLA